jgi:hypothetical protein
MFWKLYVLGLFRCVQPRFVILRHVTSTVHFVALRYEATSKLAVTQLLTVAWYLENILYILHSIRKQCEYPWKILVSIYLYFCKLSSTPTPKLLCPVLCSVLQKALEKTLFRAFICTEHNDGAYVVLPVFTVYKHTYTGKKSGSNYLSVIV